MAGGGESVVLVWGLMLFATTLAVSARENLRPINRSYFPPGFLFGTSSSAYQVEGAAEEDGRGPSIWDVFTHSQPKGGSGGDVAVDSYHRYKTDFKKLQEDVKIMKELGFEAYRFSISWTRILPYGSLRGGVNRKGINYYNNLINELISRGVQPFVTLFHWDFPQALEDEYGGFLSPKAVADFEDYAEVCFREFGDRVKRWITINEAWRYSVDGYAWGESAPARCSSWEAGHCAAGDSATEPYLVAHHLLLAHAAAVKLYRDKFQAAQQGTIGIINVANWFVPLSTSDANNAAAQRAFDFMFGWFMDPLSRGEYPSSMRSYVGNRLPNFTKEQAHMLKGSFDFIGLNYYTTKYASYVPLSDTIPVSYTTDSHVNVTVERNGTLIGPRAASSWLYVYPTGIRDMLVYVKNRYNNPVTYVTENGVDEFNNDTISVQEASQDDLRIDFHRRHLLFVQQAIREGVDVRGYFVWSLMDDFEWAEGYSVRFGLVYVDYKDDLKRYLKQSALWFRQFLNQGCNGTTQVISSI